MNKIHNYIFNQIVGLSEEEKKTIAQEDGKTYTPERIKAIEKREEAEQAHDNMIDNEIDDAIEEKHQELEKDIAEDKSSRWRDSDKVDY